MQRWKRNRNAAFLFHGFEITKHIFDYDYDFLLKNISRSGFKNISPFLFLFFSFSGQINVDFLLLKKRRRRRGGRGRRSTRKKKKFTFSFPIFFLF